MRSRELNLYALALGQVLFHFFLSRTQVERDRAINLLQAERRIMEPNGVRN